MVNNHNNDSTKLTVGKTFQAWNVADIAARRNENTRKDTKVSILIDSQHRISKYETFFTCQNRPWIERVLSLITPDKRMAGLITG